MLTLKEIVTGIKESILFHTKGVRDKSRADDIAYQVEVVTESVLRQFALLKQHIDTIDLRLKKINSLESKATILAITKVPKSLKLEPLPEIIKEQDIELTQEELHSIFEYRDGDLYWKIRARTRIKIGDMAGYKYFKKSGGERFVYHVKYKGKTYIVSRLIFKMFHNWLPEVVQCIDGNYLNTKIENLRAANRSQSSYRNKKVSNNSSGYKGVQVSNNKWKSTIRQQKKLIHLGTFNNKKEAHKVYCEAAKKLYGEFANFG